MVSGEKISESQSDRHVVINVVENIMTNEEKVISLLRQDTTIFTFAQANSRIYVGKKAPFYCMVPIKEKEDDKDIKKN